MELNSKRIIITGVTGFIGRYVAQQLLQNGAQVYGVIRPNSNTMQLLPKHRNFHVVLGTMDTIAESLKQFDSADAFLHFAWGGVNREEIDSTEVQGKNISGSLKCLEEAIRLRCGIFMDAGSRVEYGQKPDGVMSESMPCNPINAYGIAKLNFFHKAEALCKERGMTYYHLRFFSVYGKGDHPWSIISTLTRELPQGKNVKLSACRHKWNFMDISDAASAVVELLLHSEKRHGEIHIVNVASSDTRPLRDFVEEIYSLCGKKGTLEYGTFVQAKEGALSICPEINKLRELTDGYWKEEVTFAEGICKILGEAI